jgi:hypothetical protein
LEGKFPIVNIASYTHTELNVNLNDCSLTLKGLNSDGSVLTFDSSVISGALLTIRTWGLTASKLTFMHGSGSKGVFFAPNGVGFITMRGCRVKGLAASAFSFATVGYLNDGIISGMEVGM